MSNPPDFAEAETDEFAQCCESMLAAMRRTNDAFKQATEFTERPPPHLHPLMQHVENEAQKLQGYMRVLRGEEPEFSSPLHAFLHLRELAEPDDESTQEALRCIKAALFERTLDI